MSEIHLQGGFENEPVTVRFNDQEVFRADAVTTQLLTGVAQCIELPDAVGPARVQVHLRKLGISTTIDVKQAGDFCLGISVEGKQIMHQIADEPFGYA